MELISDSQISVAVITLTTTRSSTVLVHTLMLSEYSFIQC